MTNDKIAEIRARHEAGAPGEMPIWALAQADADREFLLSEIDRLREALQVSACTCLAIRECASAWSQDGHCPHFVARRALEAKP